MKYRQNGGLAKSLYFAPRSDEPHAELNVVEVDDTEICALSVFLISLVSVFLLHAPPFTFPRPLDVDTGIICTQWSLCIGTVVLSLDFEIL